MSIPKIPRATPAQINYIEQLLIDLELGNRKTEKALISRMAGREIKFLDELTKMEASLIIESLREWKDRYEEWEEDEEDL